MHEQQTVRTCLVLVLAAVLAGNAQAQRSGGGKPGKTTTSDTTPPTLALPGDLRAEATGASGAAVNYTVSASDNVDRRVSASCSPPSGATFALGRTPVNCEARDSAGNRTLASFVVTVADTLVPTLGLPGPLSLDAPDDGGTVVNFQVSASDRVDPNPAIDCTPASGSVFAIGSTTVQCVARDASGNASDGSFVVAVTATTTAQAEPTPTPPPEPAPAGTASLSWTVPTTRANGAPLATSELAGYEIYVLTESNGETSVITLQDPLLTSFTVNSLPADVYHFAVGAVDTAGMVSELSSVVSKEVR